MPNSNSDLQLLVQFLLDLKASLQRLKRSQLCKGRKPMSVDKHLTGKYFPYKAAHKKNAVFAAEESHLWAKN